MSRPSQLDIKDEIDSTNYGKYLNTTRAHQTERTPSKLVPHKFPSSESIQPIKKQKKIIERVKTNKNQRNSSTKNFFPKYPDLNPLINQSNDDLQFE